ncbi:NAD(P)-binding domain-containing protein [Paramicrobacterium agarici]|uniref:3-hydroxyisobutyrate dehydrogenase-like beta-hydroxyacid dehydrogenase n=1 Tax=Paramicrobacterium agarici TaxID=630514 RepID=A0A2A9DTW6_9MICO|nr:NAD(P)-binding domain-containing protein [Microbacterium agarici]PFG30034.1 3-hydroxyisobutyrate dehydrogenase-like beta-hydroxyacid dehydrogenase [Microbacterium agarici]
MTAAVIIGLGEAGELYARGLRDCGYTTVGFDPFVTLNADGIAQAATIEEAVASADLVLSLVGARAASAVGEQAIPVMQHGAVFADLNTSSPELKARLAHIASAHKVLFADVAVLAPVPREGARTPLMASGDGADEFADLMSQVGAPVESIGGEPGDAAGRKLLRSVFMKGLAAVLLESMTAASEVGQAAWLRDQIASEFSGDARQLIERLIAGSREHAERRVHETEDANAYLDSLGAPNWSTKAAHAWLSRLRDEPRTSDGLSSVVSQGKDAASE